MSTPAHVRIDEGVKRGPRKPYNIRKRDPLTGRALALLPADLKPSTVLERYLSDERTADIAASYGVARSRLNGWLLEHAEDQWKKAQAARAITALEQAKDDLESAQDPLSLARAREQLRSAQWDLERLVSRLYGFKQSVEVSVAVSVEHRLETSASQLLDAFVALPQQSAVQQDQDDESLSTEEDQAIDV